MRNMFVVAINLLGLAATALVFLFMSIRAFNKNGADMLPYNDSFFLLAVIAATWLVLHTVRYSSDAK